MGFLGQPGGQVQPLPGAVSLDSVLINLNANTNNLQAGQFVSLIKLMPSIALNLTGLMFGIADRQVVLRNVGLVSITLKNADGGSDAANQFLFGADVILAAGGYTELIYSSELSGWTLVNASAGGAGNQSATAPVIVNSATIITASTAAARVAPGGAVTGIILQNGAVPAQRVVIINESAALSTITMAASATSHVANGVACVIAGLSAKGFTWDSVTALWYPEN